MSKKIILTGATGVIGSRLCKLLISRGDKVIVLSRDVKRAKDNLRIDAEFINWNYISPLSKEVNFDEVNAVIHLAGANLFERRWDNDYKKIILESRTLSTRILAQSINSSSVKPSVFISSSAVGYYGNKGNEIITESSLPGNDFLSSVCKQWENESIIVESSNVRRVNIRTGIVLNSEEGALKQMLLPFKLFIGGPIGNGKQWFPWIHIEDILNIYLFALDNDNIGGPLNAASPNPVLMKNFANNIGKILKRPSFFPVPVSALKIVLGEVAGVISSSQRIIPEKLLNNRFRFKYEFLNDALEDLLKKG